MKRLQDLLEHILFGSRWILAPMYLGLVLALFLLVFKFGQSFLHTLHEFGKPEVQLGHFVYLVLELVDVVLVSNLLLMIIFSGYENFISKIEVASGHIDRPSWMGTIDYSALKLKIIGSVVAISSIELLKLFLEVGELGFTDEKGQLKKVLTKDEQDFRQWRILWMIILHGTFVVSGLIFAFTEKISHGHGILPATGKSGSAPQDHH